LASDATNPVDQFLLVSDGVRHLRSILPVSTS
jgi:hypothetical protein